VKKVALALVLLLLAVPIAYSQDYSPVRLTTAPPNGLSGTVILVPHDSSLVIPPGGGNFCFDAIVTNSTGHSVHGFIWGDVYSAEQNKHWVPLLLTEIEAGPYETKSYEDICLFVPYCVDPGAYIFICNVGCYPNVTDADTIEFSKNTGAEGPLMDDGDCPPEVFINANTILPVNTIVSECQRNSGDPEIGIMPTALSVGDIYPNPFNAATKITFNLNGRTAIKVDVVNLMGEMAGTLLNKELPAGNYELNWNAADYPSGIYFLKFSTSEETIVKKTTLVK